MCTMGQTLVREHCATDPHACIHRQSSVNTVFSQRDRGVIPLATGLFALGRHRGSASCRGDLLIGLIAQSCRMYVDVTRLHHSVFIHGGDAGVARCSPNTGVGGYGQPHIASKFESSCLGETLIPGHIESDLGAEYPRIILGAFNYASYFEVFRPFPWRGVDVAVCKHKAARGT